MTAYTCGGCGEEFTDDRETAVAYQDTTRCPCCGQKADAGDIRETTSTSTDATGALDASDLSVNVEISFGGESAQAAVSADAADGGDQ